MARKKADFEKSLTELETLVQQMESGKLSLEDSLKAFERGIRLTRECQQALSLAEQKVQLLLADNDEFTLEELETDDDDA